jgi:hypothetical protein
LTALAAAADNGDRARELAEVLTLRAHEDPAFAQTLLALRRDAEALERLWAGSGDVHNEISRATRRGGWCSG